MKSVTLIFQVHQPLQFRRYRFFDIGADHSYYEVNSIKNQIQKLSEQCYIPANDFLLRQVIQMEGKLKVAFYISGITLRLMREYAPEAMESFRKLGTTGCVEFLSGTYAYSLSSLAGPEALQQEALRHRQTIGELIGCTSSIFYNTGLIYSDEIGAMLAGMGYQGVITEGAKHTLGWKTPGALYGNPLYPHFKIFLRNSRLSNDLTFSDPFQTGGWDQFTHGQLLSGIVNSSPEDQLFNIILEYEDFGSVLPGKRKVFQFLDQLLFQVSRSQSVHFANPEEIAGAIRPDSLLHVPHPLSWSGDEHDLTCWNGNDLQQEAFSKLYELLPQISRISDTGLFRDWSFLQESHHFIWMSTAEKPCSLHGQPNPYDSPFDAFINYMNILNDLKIRLDHIEATTEY